MSGLQTLLLWNIPEVPNVGGARAKKRRNFWCPAHSLQKSFSYKPMVPMASVYSEGVPFGVLTPKWGTLNQKKWVPDIHFVYLSDVKKIRWIQLWNYFSNPTKSDGVIAGRLGQGRIQAYEKHRNVPLTPVIYNITARSQWHKCVGCGLWCAAKIWKFLTREEPQPKNGRTSGILRTYRKKF